MSSVARSRARPLPAKRAARPVAAAGHPDLIERAHKVGLLRAHLDLPQRTAPPAVRLRRQPVNEYLEFYKLGIDGVFSDFPDTAVVARVLFELEGNRDAGRCLTGERDGPRGHEPDCD